MTLRIRLIVLAITLFCFILIALQVRRRQMHATYLVLWTSLCVLSLPLVIFPGSVDRVSEWLGIYYPPATIFLAATVVLFLISIHFSREITRLEERTRVLAEELAFLRLESEQASQAPTPAARAAPPSAESPRPTEPSAESLIEVAAAPASQSLGLRRR